MISINSYADSVSDSKPLRDAVSTDAIMSDLQTMQNLTLANGGNRLPGTPGFFAVANYFINQLSAAGYTVTTQPYRGTENIIAELQGQGDPSKVFLISTQLNTVVGTPGPGINTLGSAAATALEIAKAIPTLNQLFPKQVMHVRFLFFGGFGGASGGNGVYINSLSDAAYQNIVAVTGMGPMGSTNGCFFVLDGDNDIGINPVAPPDGSGQIEQLYLDYFASLNLNTVPDTIPDIPIMSPWVSLRTPFKPIGGISTAPFGGVKTSDQVAICGGTAGIPYDPNLGTVNDTITNVDSNVLGIMKDAEAHMIFSYIRNKDLHEGNNANMALQAIVHQSDKWNPDDGSSN